MSIIGLIAYVALVVLAATWAWGLRRDPSQNNLGTALSSLLLVVFAVLVPSVGLNKLHALWMIPAGMLFGTFLMVTLDSPRNSGGTAGCRMEDGKPEAAECWFNASSRSLPSPSALDAGGDTGEDWGKGKGEARRSPNLWLSLCPNLRATRAFRGPHLWTATAFVASDSRTAASSGKTRSSPLTRTGWTRASLRVQYLGKANRGSWMEG